MRHAQGELLRCGSEPRGPSATPGATSSPPLGSREAATLQRQALLPSGISPSRCHLRLSWGGWGSQVMSWVDLP